MCTLMPQSILLLALALVHTWFEESNSGDEEEQTGKSFIFVSSESTRGIGQKNLAFWLDVAVHYNRHKPDGRADCLAKSLRT